MIIDMINGVEIISVENRCTNELVVTLIVILVLLGLFGFIFGISFIFYDYKDFLGWLFFCGGLIFLTFGCIGLNYATNNYNEIYTVYINNETNIEELCDNYEVIEVDGPIWKIQEKETMNKNQSLNYTYIENNGSVLIIEEGKVIKEFKIEEEN